jgi:hypothetical protein
MSFSLLGFGYSMKSTSIENVTKRVCHLPDFKGIFLGVCDLKSKIERDMEKR